LPLPATIALRAGRSSEIGRRRGSQRGDLISYHWADEANGVISTKIWVEGRLSGSPRAFGLHETIDTYAFCVLLKQRRMEKAPPKRGELAHGYGPPPVHG